jgi:16S rRNA (guanine(966)-N(2))-methyltransferase RsmD
VWRKVRPTTGRVKKALFDILGPSVKGSKFLDLFAGTGAIGLEALRRGAQMAVFVEVNERLARRIGEEIEKSWHGKAIVIKGDAISAIRRLSGEGHIFDIVFMDPPYGGGMAEAAISKLSSSEVIRDNGIVVLEHSSRDGIGERFGDLILYRRERYGDTMLSFFLKKGEA